MAERFNLTAQLQLQAPRNVGQVVGQIKRQLQGVTTNVQVKGDARAIAKVNKELRAVDKSARGSAASVGRLNRNLSEAARRFSVITVATGTMLAFAHAVKNAVGEAISFERELVKISQVSGKSVKNLQGLTKEITRLSTSLGASSSDLLNVSRILTQAGFSAQKTKQALDILAKTSLGATFDDIRNTTEGAIAVLRQFRAEAQRAGGDIKFLEQTMDAINAVSKRFAVESNDLISVVRRVGGVFETAGGSVNELIALFTSVRATTRETAETIATGLRTIFTRIQRTETVDMLKQLGIELRNAQGQFVGSYEAVRRLSEGLAGLDPRDFRFSQIVEQLGGFRQIGKVIPMIRQFTTAQQALNVAQAASGSVTKDAITAQQSLAVQAARVKEEFSALMRNFADSSTFRSVAKGALELARAFIKIADALTPMIPLLTTLMAMKIGSALAPGLGMMMGMGRGRRRATGGKIHKFSTGGFVPGSGNSDSVPAMLQPGEFVIKKSSAQKLGASSLHAMNRYNNGGRVAKIKATQPEKYGVFALNADKESLAAGGRKVDRKTALDRLIPQIIRKEATKGAKAAQANLVGKSGAPSKGFSNWLHGTKGISTLKTGTASAYKAMEPATKKSLQNEYLQSRTSKTKGAQGQKSDITGVSLQGPFNVLGISGKNNKGELMQDLGPDFEKASRAALKFGVKKIAQSELVKNLNIPPLKGDEQKLFNFNGLFEGAQETLEGYLLEGVIGALTAAKIGGGGINFDFPKLTKTAKTRLKKLFGENNAVTPMIAADAKRTASSATSGENSIQNKIASVLGAADFQLLNRGGAVDSVPAMLTPGEYVVNRSSAQAIGYSNLNKMNKTGVQHFANGGVVQYMSNGGKKDAGGAPKFNPRIIAGPATKISQKLAKIVANFEAMGLSTEQMEKATKVAEKALRTKTKGGKKVEGTGLGMEAAFKKGLEETSRQQTKKERVGGAPVIGPQPLAAGAKEQREPLSVGSGPKFGQQKAANTLAENQAKASAELKSYTSDQNSLNKGISAYNHAIREGKSHEKAMSRARQASAKALRGGSQITQAGFEKAEKLNAARGVLASKLGSAAKTVGKRAIAAPVKGVAGGIGTVGKGVGTALRGLDPFSAGGEAARKKTAAFGRGAGQKVQGTAAAMQQFVFLGAAVTAVTSQMSGLSETTKKAVNETAGFAAGIVGITGTVVQTMTSLITSNAAETLASTQSAVADNAEATASMKASAAGAKFGGALSGMMIGISAAVVALKFFSAKNKAIADESKKKWTSALNNIKTSAGASAEEITKSMGAEMEARTKSAKQMDGTAIGMVASMAATGAAIGAFGGPLGAAIGGVVGAGIGFAGAMLRAESATDDTLAARNQEINAIKKTVANLVDLNNAQRNLSESLKDIDAAGLSPERQIEMRLQAGGEALRTDAVGKSAEADARISKIAAQIGASSAAVRATEGDKDRLQALAKKSGMSSSKANDVAARASTALTVELMAQKSAHELAAATVKATSDTYAKAADGIRAASNFTELRKALPAFAASLRQKQQALAQAAQLEIAAADQKVDIAAKEGGATLEAAKQNLIDVKKRHAQAAKLANEGHRKTIAAVKKRIREDLLAAKAAEAFRKQMIKTNKFMKQLGAISDAHAKQTKQLKGQQALIENKDLDFSVTQAQGLGDLTMIRDLKKFDRELRTSIGDLPPVMRAEALKLAKGVKETAVLVTKGKEFLVGKRIGPRDKAPSAADILKSVGIDPNKVDKSILANMQTQVAKAFEDQQLDAAEFDKIFEPFIKKGQQQAKALAAIQGEVNKSLANHALALNNQLAVLEKRRAAELSMIDIQTKNAVMLAKARGADDADIGKILDRQETKRAQAALGGVGVRAGDIGGAVAAREAAEKRRAQIEKERHNMNLSTAARKKLMTEDKKMQIVIQRTTAEIQRLGNQSEKAGRLMDQIDAERAKREVLTGLVTDFVVGGQEERQAMQKSVMGIQFAMATGTLQTQSPEQRQATVGMLDKLADIEIPGAGGMTGKEVKQKLVFDDAVRMGLDPKIAQQLAKATTKEEKLITALEKLTTVMEAANKVEAEGKAMGGLIHLAGGGSTIFKPRGTDTVPAMLTPGEFVIKKSSVDKYGVGMMSAINAGRFANGGRVSYLQDGGKSSFWQAKIPRYKTTRIYHDEKHPDAMPGTSMPTPTWQRAKKSSGPTHRGSASEVVTVGGRKYPNRFWPTWEEWGDKYGPDHGLLSLFKFKDWNKNQGPGFLKANEFGDPATESFNPFGFKRSFADVVGPKQHAYQKRMNKLRWMEEQERKKKLEEAARRKFNFASGGVVYASLGGGITTMKEIERRKAIEKRMAPLKKASMRTTLGPSPLGPALNFLANLGVEKIKQRAGFGAKTPVPEPTIGPSRLGGQVTPAVQKAYDEMQRNKKRGSWMEAFGFAEGGFVYPRNTRRTSWSEKARRNGPTMSAIEWDQFKTRAMSRAGLARQHPQKQAAFRAVAEWVEKQRRWKSTKDYYSRGVGTGWIGGLLGLGFANGGPVYAKDGGGIRGKTRKEFAREFLPSYIKGIAASLEKNIMPFSPLLGNPFEAWLIDNMGKPMAKNKKALHRIWEIASTKEVPYFSRRKMMFQETWNVTKPFEIIDGMVIPKKKAAAYKSRKKAIQVANAMKENDWKRVLQIDPKNKKALQMKDAAERAAKVEESRRKHAERIAQFDRLIQGKPSSIPKMRGGTKLPPKGPGFSRPEPRRNVLDIPSQGMSQHGVSPIELMHFPNQPSKQKEFETQKAQWQQFTGAMGKLGGGIKGAIQKKRAAIQKKRAATEKKRQETQFREQFIGGGKPTPSKPGKFDTAWQKRFGEKGRAAHQAAIDESIASGGRGHVTASPVNVAAKAAMDRADREMALFKAQQARQAPAQPAQTRGVPFTRRGVFMFADGGQVDSVPAMLTPGEFVMNRDAVQRYGTGFMSRLNRGNLPGFNNGGVVGAKYFQNGSTSAVKQGGGFNFGSLAGMLDTMTKAFPTLNNVITKLQNVFSDLNMTHNFKGDMSLAFSVTNTDALKQSIADAITPHISDLITRELDNRFGGFNATGP